MGRFCSRDVEQFLMKCLSKDPADRFGSTGELDKAMFVVQHNHGLVLSQAPERPKSEDGMEAD
jgi:hypothetical protein